MVEILSGFISGIVCGVGMGGGTILILCLSIFCGLDQKIAQATNLIFFIPTSIAAICINIKEKKIDFNVTKIIVLFGIIRSNFRSIYCTKNGNKIVKTNIWNFSSNYINLWNLCFYKRVYNS